MRFLYSGSGMAVRVPSRSLKNLLLLGMLLCSLFGTVSNPPGSNPVHHRQVDGILGGSVLLPVNISSSKGVDRVQWDFHPQTGELEPYQFAKLIMGDLKPLNLSNQFGRRLEMDSQTTLRIKDLKMEDSGVYKVHTRFNTSEIQEDSFNISVYEPVPEPQIHPKLASKAPEGCNVTLQCQVSGKGGSSISWKRGNPLRDLEDISDCYQLSDNGRDLHLFHQPKCIDTNFTCMVYNPVDQKHASFDLSSICQSEGESQLKWEWSSTETVLAVVVAGIILMLILCPCMVVSFYKKKKERQAKKEMASLESSLDLQKVLFTNGESPSEGDKHQELVPLCAYLNQSPTTKASDKNV